MTKLFELHKVRSQIVDIFANIRNDIVVNVRENLSMTRTNISLRPISPPSLDYLAFLYVHNIPKLRYLFYSKSLYCYQAQSKLSWL